MVTDELLAALLDEDLDAARRAEFEAEVLSDEAACGEVFAQRKIAAGLRALLGTDQERLTQAILTTTGGLSHEAIARRVVAMRPHVVPRPKAQRAPFRLPETTRSSWWIPLAAAAAVAIAAFVSWRSFFPVRTSRHAEIAVLTRAMDAVWANANFAPQPGRRLHAGLLRLRSGAVQIEFMRGVRVVLEGPAEFELVGENEGNLRSGNLWARVPPAAQGFKVRTRGFTAVDLGTEFGCVAPSTGPTELHVFNGAVEMQTPAADRRKVAENRAVRLDGSITRELAAQRGAFLGEAQMPQRTGFLRGSRTSEDIGNPRVRGFSSVDPKSGAWTVAGGGADIYGASDQFHFVSQEFQGDGSINAKVSAIEHTDPYSKAGVMFRASPNADAAFAYAFVGPRNIGFEYRSSRGEQVTRTAYVGGTAPTRVKVERRGSSFAGYYSVDGIAWKLIGEAQTVAIPAVASAGLAVTARNDSALNRSSFENVSSQP